MQYLDLKIITTYISPDKTLTDSDFADHIFPPDHDSDIGALDKLRSTTKPTSNKVIDQDFINRLLSAENKKQIKF